jgi:predicted nucleotidyltransferase
MISTSVELSEPLLLSNMVTVIVEVANPDKIILFGSKAKGTDRVDSDYDLLIIKEKAFFETHSRRKETGKIGRALSKFRVSKDILMYSADEVEQRQHWRNSVISCALQEGKVLYEKS